MAEVRLINLKKDFGPVQVLKDINLLFPDGEFVVVLGPSGCGKTTLLRLIAGLEEATSGEIYIGERKVNDLPPKDRDIAMVFQSYALYPHMDVYQNMAFGLRMRKMPREEIDKRVKRAAEMLELTPFLNRKPRALSGGQRQRVALGRAIVRNPKVFLMDEPLSNLDAKLRVQTRVELSKLHQRLGVTTIYVTHDQVEAMTLGNLIVIMNNGIVQQVGAAEEIYDRPANRFVAGFIGSPPMNFFSAVLQNDGEPYLQIDSLRLSIPPQHLEAVRPYLSKEVTVGIRPEDITVGEGNGLTRVAVRAKVDVLEVLGSETYLYLSNPEGPSAADSDSSKSAQGQSPTGKAPSLNFVARVEPSVRTRVGEIIEVIFKMDRAHLFDLVSEKAIF